MRPRKRVLLIDADETRRSILSFVLTTRGFRMFDPQSNVCDLVIAHWPGDIDLAVTLAASFEVPLLVISKKDEKEMFDVPANHFIKGNEYEPWLIVEAAKTLSARKRGPKKGFRKGLHAESMQGKGPASHGTVRNSLEQSKAVRDGAAA